MNILKLHEGGKLIINSKIKIDSNEILSAIYTPGVAEVSTLIAKNPEEAKKYTIAGNTVAIVTDGTAVLGLGDIGAKAALPVMEGKAAIFKEFADINAFPICLDTKDPREIIETVQRIAPNFAAINLEDISSPRCFEIEDQLDKLLDIPVMHDDQHGTAIVMLTALRGAIKLTGKKNVRIIVNGAGAAGTAITKLLSLKKVKDMLNIIEIKVIDSKGVIARNRDSLHSYKINLANITQQKKTESFEAALKGADVFIGVSVGNILSRELIQTMNSDPIIFAMANPTPEVMPDIAMDAGASIVATGRSDFPNQINNALVYPGIFKGLIKSGIQKATDEVKLAASNAIFSYHKKELSITNLLPSILDSNVPDRIAEAITSLG